MPYAADLALALRLAEAVDAVTLPGSLGDISVELKPDDTPVTAIDRAAERLVRDLLAAERPDDAVVGEEFAATAGTTGRRWVIDPIDGTKNFVRGVPVWATLIGLLDGDEAVVGVVSAPALGRRWWGSAGGGAWSSTSLPGFPAEPRRLAVSTTSSLADASISFSSLDGWEARGSLEAFVQLTRDTWRLRGFGDFWNYVLVAEGAVDIAAEPQLALHDMAALVPIVTEAGGRFTALDGTAGPFGGNALATNGVLHDEVLARLA